LVIGGGSWGTAFADYLSGLFEKVRIWIREAEIISAIQRSRENSVFLPGVRLAANLEPVSDLESEIAHADILVFAVPSKFARALFQVLGRKISPNQAIVNLTKGIEAHSLKTISEMAAEVAGPKILANWLTLSGPSFAAEFARRHPTAIVAASSNEELLRHIQHDFSSPVLRIYRSHDLRGVEVGGSVKNIMAIASGMANGLGFGYNTIAALITRASVEIARLAESMGARRETIWGLAGMGDLILTCTGSLSRNYQLGRRIAQGETLSTIENSTPMVSEGVETTRAVKRISQMRSVDMPITAEVHEVLFNHKPPAQALNELMIRSLKPEWNIN